MLEIFDHYHLLKPYVSASSASFSHLRLLDSWEGVGIQIECTLAGSLNLVNKIIVE